MATKWSTSVDPVSWSVDEVVSYLCDPTNTPWLPSPNSPRPDSSKLEAALRANDVCGEILLALDLDTTKDLGIGSLGQRITLMKAVVWLRAHTKKENDEATVVCPPNSPKNTIADAFGPECNGNSLKKAPRRVAPTLVTETPPDPNITDAFSQNPLSQDSDGFRKLSQREEDFYDRILQKYPPEGSDEGLELYGDSDFEEELDPETWKEVLDENPHLRPTSDKREPSESSNVLSLETCEGIIQTYIMDQEDVWCRKNLASFSSQLDPLWSSLRDCDQIDAKKAEIKTSIAPVEERLKKLTGALFEGKCQSAKQLLKLCGSLDATISFLEEKRWMLELISTDDPPSKVARAHRKKLLEPDRGDDSSMDEASDKQTGVVSDGESLDSEPEIEYVSRELVSETESGKRQSWHLQPTTELARTIHTPDSTNVDDSSDDFFERLKEKSIDSIEQEQNKRELLAKLIMTLEDAEIEEMAKLLKKLLSFIFLEKTRYGIRAMLLDRREVTSNDPEFSLFMRISALYLAWHTCRRINHDIGIDRNILQDTLETLRGDECPYFYDFFGDFEFLIGAHRRWSHGFQEGTESSSSVESESDLKEADADRLIISSKVPEAPILLNSELSQNIKPHQLEGIRFMWREICESEVPQGCLLAHDMGLGKTMQVVTMLLTIAESRLSSDPRVRNQVPLELQRKERTLILCPAALVQNWIDELTLWIPKKGPLGKTFSLAKTADNRNFHGKEPRQRYRAIIARWKEENGILILSYDMFRSLTKQSNGYSSDQAEGVRSNLLHRTNIVVADEAHKLSSNGSLVAELARLVKTKYRIAMTGTPLSNNLIEWFRMIDWISPGYLGTPSDFKRRFMGPIQEGMGTECTKAQRRNGLKAQRLLTGILSPRYHRIEISAIASELPPKIEFAISILLTNVQLNAYNAFVEEVNGTELVKSTLSWLSLLQLCCNNPFLFIAQLRLRKDREDSAKSLTNESHPNKITPELLDRIQSILDQASGLPAAAISYRWLILDRILGESERVGDKVLVFSQSIPTVMWLEGLLHLGSRRYCRIDGDSDSTERQANSRSFNSGNDIQIMLISTRAGGVGLNLFGANRVVIFDSTFNPMWENQAVGRAYRMGQQKPVFVYRFRSSGTFEDLLYHQAITKTELFQTIVNKKDIYSKGAKNKTKWLFRVKNEDSKPLNAIMGKDPEVFDRIAASEIAPTIVAADVYDFKEEDEQLTEAEKAEVEHQLAEEAANRSRRASLNPEY